MKITSIQFYGAARQKVCRLGLSDIFLELQELLLATRVEILPEKQANSAGVVREMIDSSFLRANSAVVSEDDRWKKNVSGDIDWVKRLRYNCTLVAKIGVEIQVSGRSDLLARDIVHIRNSLQDSSIDVGVIVVPSDGFEFFLTDRAANLSYAKRYVEEELREAKDYPIILIAVEHDGESATALPKKLTNRGKAEKMTAKKDIARKRT